MPPWEIAKLTGAEPYIWILRLRAWRRAQAKRAEKKAEKAKYGS